MTKVLELGLQNSAQILSWKEIREQVFKVNPVLAKLIDQLDPAAKSHSLIKTRLPFGARILEKGKIILPNGESPLNESLNYSAVPLMMSLNKSAEVFIEVKGRSVPIQLLGPGQIWGLLEVLSAEMEQELTPPWSMTVGAHTIFMLAKITDSHGHQRLRKELRLPYALPQSIWEHEKIFAAIANSPSFKDKWYSEVIFFPEPWAISLKQDPAWQNLRIYLFEQTYRQVAYLRQQSSLNMFSVLSNLHLTNSSPKLRPYLLETVKHLLSLANHAVPGFRAAGNSELAAPISILEQVYVEIYELRDYLPIIMHPCYTTQNKDLTCYYSMATPTLLTGYPTTKTLPNIIQELRGVKHLLDVFCEKLAEHKIFNSALLKNVSFDYFHTNDVPSEKIRSTQIMPEEDPLLLQTSRSYHDRIFPAAGPFLRGCVRISRKK